MHLISFLIAALLNMGAANALYSANGPVKLLNAKEFAAARKKHPLMVVEFFAPWCGHCKQLTPTWEEVARTLDGILPVVAVDADSERDLASEFGIKGFPTIKMVSQKGAVDYKGERSTAGIISWAMEQATKFVQKRAGVTGGASGSAGGGASSDSFFGASSRVVALTDDNFDALVTSSNDGILVMFYAPWCGHCKSAKPEFVRAAKELEAEEGIQLAAVDCTAAGQQVCQRFGVQGYPTFKFFGANKRSPIEYESGRDKDSFVAFAKEHSSFARVAPPAEVTELTSQAIFEDTCLGKQGKGTRQLCVIAFLPHLLDSKASGRRKYIQVLEAMRDSSKGKPYSFLWATGGEQPALEANFGVGGFGYPALVVLSPKRSTYVLSTDPYSAEGAKEFLRRVSNAFVRPLQLNGELASVASVDPWDGGEAKVEMEEEEISLEELMKEEF